jgi:hypothetical protein
MSHLHLELESELQCSKGRGNYGAPDIQSIGIRKVLQTLGLCIVGFVFGLFVGGHPRIIPIAGNIHVIKIAIRLLILGLDEKAHKTIMFSYNRTFSQPPSDTSNQAWSRLFPGKLPHSFKARLTMR